MLLVLFIGRAFINRRKKEDEDEDEDEETEERLATEKVGNELKEVAKYENEVQLEEEINEEEEEEAEEEEILRQKEEDRRLTRTAALYLYLAFLLCSAAFEPDFGSWIRHQGVALPIILLIL